MKKAVCSLFVLLALVLVASSISSHAQAQTKPSAKAVQTTKGVKVDFKDVKLANGLRVLIAEDHTAPVISLAVTYNTGSRNERQGRTGFAHLFEHMMFKGSENVGTGEHMLLVFNNGGNLNGSTNEDRTNYFEELPANQLDLALFLEADRMRSLPAAITKENLDNQRNAVQEERRLGVDNQPYGKTEEKFQETMYDNFTYKHSVIGSMQDLNAASVEDVIDFFHIYYAPNNAVLALVGDFKTDEALAKIKKYFEPIPSHAAPPPVDSTEPDQTAERRFTMEDQLARLPQLAIGYKGFVGNTPDFYAMQVLNQALASGQSSRLYQILVKEKELVANIFGFVREMRGPGYYQLTATLKPTTKFEDVEAVINEEIAKLQQEPIADWELQKAKNSARRFSVQALQSTLGVAIRLSQYGVYYNDPSLINTQFEKVDAVTKADVQRVANKYLKVTNRTVAQTVPKPKTAASPAGMER
ncbi:MAG: insulinase family protein [Acidobacteriia bacterium]|nr:insulinase family protein [Terriglobia bacterium]